MEKERILLNSLPPLNYRASSSPAWQSSGLEVHGDMNSSSETLASPFLNLNWENSVDQSMPFRSALSSMVSSSASGPAAVPADNIVIRELIGRLGSICNNSGEISPQSQTLGTSYINSASNSCYSTPLNSPPKLNLGMNQSGGNMPILGNSLVTPQSLTQFATDPGFVERAAKFSCFGSRNYSGLASQFGLQESELVYRSMPLESGKLSRASSSHSLKGGAQASVLDNKEIITLSGPLHQDGSEADLRSVSGSDRKISRLSRSATPNGSETEFSNNGREESSASDQINGRELKGPSEVNARKRKAVPRGKTKDQSSSPSVKNAKAEEDGSKLKKCKPEAAVIDKVEEKPKVEQTNSNSDVGDGNQMQTKDNPKPPEPPKQDYIHVRARRGQATDSHSLAERVRREKISERMKFLQDLVPGCNKVTGKAVMLDEIINYVQSLQRQVEFLSMKLATVNPRLDFNMEELLTKDMLQSRGPSPHMAYTLDSSASSFSYGLQNQQGPISTGLETQCSVNPLELRRSLSMQVPTSDGYNDAVSQLTTFWDDELQSVVQMGFGENQETVFSSQSFHASLPPAHMKLEL